MEQLTGGCHCGRVRYTINGKLGKVAFCHCESCRKATGAPVTVAVMGLKDQFVFTDSQPTLYQSSDHAQRGFCSTCGTPVCWQGVWHEEEQMFVYAGTLDNVDQVIPDRQAFTNNQISWLRVNEEIPAFDQTSPAVIEIPGH